MKKHKEKKEDKSEKNEEMSDEKKKEKEPMKAGYMSSSYKMKKEEVDEHMDALDGFSSDDLSEEFKTKTCF